MEEKKDDRSFMLKLATFIVDKRNGVFLAFIGMLVFCLFAQGWVAVCDDITQYLPGDSETRQGLTLMEDEVTTYATARVMVSNISRERASEIAAGLESIEGISAAAFLDEDSDVPLTAEDIGEHYRLASALFDVTFEGEEGDEICESAMAELKQRLAGYDLYISSPVGSSEADLLDAEMNIVMLVAVVIIVSVLLFTSKTYMEIPVLLMTFGSAAMINKGTNFLMGEISYITDSVAVVLQLALAIDYAIILCHRYTEEREHLDAHDAVSVALSKAIPEISASSLTTISGMVAMMFMQFGIGRDMGVVLVKAILCSLLSVFTLMPGLLMLFSKQIDRTHHRSFVPKIDKWGKIVLKTRFVLPLLFLFALGGGFYFSNRCPYVYGESTLTTAKQNEVQIAEKKVDSTFGQTNIMALMVPAGDYEKEGRLLRELETWEEFSLVQGLANTEAKDGYMVTDKLSPRQFAELADVDIEAARLLYTAYAVDQEEYGRIVGSLDSYDVPLIDIFLFLYNMKEDGYVDLDEDAESEINDLYEQLSDGKKQLQGENYTRILLKLNLPEESPETFAFLKEIHQAAEKYYDHCYLVGDSTSDYDLATSFSRDNIVISVLSALFVIIVLLFTFQSAGLPVLLIAVIQSSVWINFSFPYLTGTNLFFLSYLIVSSIQMGANIDYAIVISNRYMELKKEMPIKEAIVETLNQSFPTIVTSGTILTAAGLLIGQLSSNPAISSIGVCLGRGTIISMLLVMSVLPQILLLGDTIIERTAFTLKKPDIVQTGTGALRVNGHVRGYVQGVVNAEIHGSIQGRISAVVDVGAMEPETEYDLLPGPSGSAPANGKEDGQL
ncbi:MAG: MMPL family transporter [Clostridiaceae bacterium]|nr:MMPL family transporter [Clostridiaceae bacterium]MCI9484008.1 MMPL family transporter [Clostridiaceae bacterium]